jgi:hypothetical protein
VDYRRGSVDFELDGRIALWALTRHGLAVFQSHAWQQISVPLVNRPALNPFALEPVMHDLSSTEALQEREPDQHHYQCPICGQTVDRKDLEQVYYHDDTPHDPRAASASRYQRD